MNKKLLFIILFLCIVPTVFGEIDLSQDLVHYWSFNERQLPFEDWISNYDVINNFQVAEGVFSGGTLKNAVPAEVMYNGTNYTQSENVTLSFFAMAESPTVRYMVAHSDDKQNAVSITYGGQKFQILTIDNGVAGGCVINYLLDQYKWYKITAVLYGHNDSCVMWVNDTFIGNDNSIDWNGDYLVSAVSPGRDYGFNYDGVGLLDDLFIWNRALNNEELDYVVNDFDTSQEVIEDYDTTLMSNVLTTLYINFSFGSADGYYTNETQAIIEFNGVNYSANKYASENNVLFNYSFTPNNVDYPTNITHKWFIEFYRFGSNHTIMTNASNQTLISFSACAGDYTYKIINISFYDEENPDDNINTTLEGNIFIYKNNFSGRSNYTISAENVFSVGICSDQSFNNTFFTTATLYSTAEQGFTQRWYLINLSIQSNSTKNVSIYNRVSTIDISDLLATIRNPQYNYLKGVYTTLQRYYPGRGEWIGVQMDKSDEFGQVFFNIREEDTDYKLLFTGDNNQIYDMTNAIKFICSDNVCEITFQVDTSVSTIAISPEYTWVFNNDTKIGELSWIDTTGTTNNVRLLVEQQTYGDSITICNKVGYSASGSLECNMSGYIGTIKVQAFSSASPEDSFFITYIYDIRDRLVDLLGESDGIVYSLGITLTIIGLSLVSPVMVIVGSIVGLLFVTLLGLTTFLTFSFVIAGTILALILSYIIGGRGG